MGKGKKIHIASLPFGGMITQIPQYPKLEKEKPPGNSPRGKKEGNQATDSIGVKSISTCPAMSMTTE